MAKQRKKKHSGKASKDQKQHATSTLAQHQRAGKILHPPLIQQVQPDLRSWINDQLPEMLWAALLFTQCDRKEAIEWIRTVTTLTVPKRPDEFAEQLSLSVLGVGDDAAANTVRTLCKQEPVRHALRPMLLFDKLPGRALWRDVIGCEPEDDDWSRLSDTVARTLNHQSNASTDCRWTQVAYMLGKGRLKFVQGMEHVVSVIQLYPYFDGNGGAQTRIRAAELGLIGLRSNKSAWPDEFWGECLQRTNCTPFARQNAGAVPKMGTTRDDISQIQKHLVAHCNATRISSKVDARHDTTFGVALYSVALLSELLGITMASTVSARLALRSILECHVALAYLLGKDDPELWKTHRVYGAGQAKLSLLKIEDLDHKPSSIDDETLRAIANEDVWQEFLSIDLGHWHKTTSGRMATDANVKEDYDAYFGWTSVFAHGHWPAVRDTVFDTCGNPLHRLHRIPRSTPRSLPDVVEDAASLVDKLLAHVDRAYPNFPHRLRP